MLNVWAMGVAQGDWGELFEAHWEYIDRGNKIVKNQNQKPVSIVTMGSKWGGRNIQ